MTGPHITIFGAGMAGLLAGAMLRNEGKIIELQPSIPNNHHALLRFRSDDIAEALNIPFQKVKVMKSVVSWRNPVADAISYSMKSTGRASIRSITTAHGKVEERYIAPPDFISRMTLAQVNPVQFDTAVDLAMIRAMREAGMSMISTLPMPVLMGILQYPERPHFDYHHGWVVDAKINLASDVCATLYFPDPNSVVLRATITGQRLQIELQRGYEAQENDLSIIIHEVMRDFGLNTGLVTGASYKEQKYAKIAPIDDRARRKFIMWATDNYGIYSLGRFAVWKAGLLLDDVYHDAKKILGMIHSGHNYSGRLPTSTKEN